jgi:hypothetical protein
MVAYAATISKKLEENFYLMVTKLHAVIRIVASESN